MATFLKQDKQIKNSKTYEYIDLQQDNDSRKENATGDSVLSLEDDLNVLRSVLRDVSGEDDWTDLPSLSLQEVKLLVQKHDNHDILFHHDRNETIFFTFENGNLVQIETKDEDILLVKTSFNFDEDEVLTEINKITYNVNGEGIYQHLKKTLNYEDGLLSYIRNEKIV